MNVFIQIINIKLLLVPSSNPVGFFFSYLSLSHNFFQTSELGAAWWTNLQPRGVATLAWIAQGPATLHMTCDVVHSSSRLVVILSESV